MRKSKSKRTHKRRIDRDRLKRSPGIFLSVMLLGLAIYLLGWSSLLSLKEIAISGTSQTSLIQSSIASTHPRISIGEPLARVDVHAVSRAIAHDEWVESSVVGRSWLHGSLTIKVRERKPVASFLDAGGVQNFFDAHGNDFHSPVIYSQVPSINLLSDTAATKIAISRLLSTLPADLLATTQSFTIKNERDLEMQVSISSKRFVTVKWGSPSDIALKVTIYHRLLALKENATATIFDLSDPLSPITK